MTSKTLLAILIATAMLTACTKSTPPQAPAAPDQATATPPPAPKPAMAGKVTTQNYGDVTLHTYVPPDDGFLVNTQIVETSAGLVIFDGNFFTQYSTEVADYVQGLGKPIERIVLSHMHPDHFSGLTVLHERFPNAPIYAFPEVTAYVKAYGQEILDARNQAFGGTVAKTPTVPAHVLVAGTAEIGGVSFVFEKVRNGEADWQTVVKLPKQHVLMAFDLVFPKNTHLFTVVNHFESWIGTLEGFKPLRDQGYTTIFVGHGQTTDFDALDGNIAYLRSAIAARKAAKTPEEYARRLKDEYPSYYGGPWVDFSSLMLYGVIKR